MPNIFNMTEPEIQQELRKAKSVNYTIFLILSAPLLILSVLLLLALFRWDAGQFTQERWEEAPEQRIQIVGSLFAKYELQGQSQGDILSLLGEDDSDRGYFTAPDRMVYYLGDEPGLLGIDSAWLILSLEKNIVTMYSITTD